MCEGGGSDRAFLGRFWVNRSEEGFVFYLGRFWLLVRVRELGSLGVVQG